MCFLVSYLTCFCWQGRWFGALDQPWITQSSSRQCLSRNGCSQTQLKAGVTGHSVLFLFSNTDTTSIPACPSVWEKKTPPFHCGCRCCAGVPILPWGPAAPTAGGKEGTRSCVLGCRSRVRDVESRADVRNGLAEPGAGRGLALLPAKGRWRRGAVSSRNSPSVCLMLLLGNFTLETFCQVNDPKNVFPFLPSWIISCQGQQLKVLF